MGVTSHKLWKKLPPYNMYASAWSIIKIFTKTCFMWPDSQKIKWKVFINFFTSIPMVWCHKDVHMHKGKFTWISHCEDKSGTPNVYIHLAGIVWRWTFHWSFSQISATCATPDFSQFSGVTKSLDQFLSMLHTLSSSKNILETESFFPPLFGKV